MFENFPREFDAFRSASELSALVEGRFNSITLAPNFPHASAALKPVPEVVPVIATVLPSRLLNLANALSKYLFASRSSVLSLALHLFFRDALSAMALSTALTL